MTVKLPRNIKYWTLVTRKGERGETLVLICKDCGLIREADMSALRADYIVCDNCGA